jgi:hypothetical protein
VVGRSFAAALALVSTVVAPPAHAAQNLGVGLRRPYRGRGVVACLRRWRAFERAHRRLALVISHFL